MTRRPVSECQEETMAEVRARACRADAHARWVKSEV